MLPGRNPRLRSLGAPEAHGSPAGFLHGSVPVCSFQSHSGPARQRGQIHLMLGSPSGAGGDIHLPTEPFPPLSDSQPLLTLRAPGSDVESSSPHPWARVHPSIHPLPISKPKCSATHPRRAANPQCHLSPHLTSLFEAHDSYDSFWPSLKKLLLISLSPQGKKEILVEHEAFVALGFQIRGIQRRGRTVSPCII